MGPPTAGGGFTATDQSPTRVRCAGADHRLVRRQVGAGHQPVVLGHAGDECLAHVARGEQRRPLGGKPRQDRGERVVAALLPAVQQGAAVTGDQGLGLGVEGEEGVGHEREVARRGRAHGVVAGGLGGRQDQTRPGECGVLLGRHREGRDDAGRGDRAVAGVHGQTAAVVGHHLPDATAEAVGVGATAGHLDVAVDDDGVASGGPHGDVRAPAQADHARLGGQGHERRRERRVHGVAALGGDGEPGLEGLLTRGGDGDPAMGHGSIFAHLPGRAGGRRSQRRGCSRERRRPQGPGSIVGAARPGSPCREETVPRGRATSAHRGEPPSVTLSASNLPMDGLASIAPQRVMRTRGGQRCQRCQSRTSILPVLPPRCRSRNASTALSRPSTTVSR